MLARTRPWSSTISSPFPRSTAGATSAEAGFATCARRNRRSPRLTSVRATRRRCVMTVLRGRGAALPFGARAKLDRRAVELGQRGPADQRQRAVDLPLEDVDRQLHTRLAEGGHAVVEGLPDHAGTGAERERLDHVRAAPDPAIENHLRPAV